MHLLWPCSATHLLLQGRTTAPTPTALSWSIPDTTACSRCSSRTGARLLLRPAPRRPTFRSASSASTLGAARRRPTASLASPDPPATLASSAPTTSLRSDGRRPPTLGGSRTLACRTHSRPWRTTCRTHALATSTVHLLCRSAQRLNAPAHQVLRWRAAGAGAAVLQLLRPVREDARLWLPQRRVRDPAGQDSPIHSNNSVDSI